MDITVALIAFVALAGSWFVLPASPRTQHAPASAEYAEPLPSAA